MLGIVFYWLVSAIFIAAMYLGWRAQSMHHDILTLANSVSSTMQEIHLGDTTLQTDCVHS